jgi:excisionase family DNA binding protein
VTINEAATKIGISTRDVRRLIQARRLGHYRPSPGRKRVVIGEHHVAAYMASVEVPAGSVARSGVKIPDILRMETGK